MRAGGLTIDIETVNMARALVSRVEEKGGFVVGAERFYNDLCADTAQSFCIYGAVNALFVVAAGLHTFLGEADDVSGKGPAHAQSYLRTAISLLGLQHCLDFIESTAWPIRSNDIISNLERPASKPFRLASDVGMPPPAQQPLVGSTLHPWSATELSDALGTIVSCSEVVRVVAVGTHPTLTLEAVGMVRDVAFAEGTRVEVSRILGITYKCAVFPNMCSVSNSGGPDLVAELIGPFDAPPADELYTLERIRNTLEVVSREITTSMDILVCTSPCIICAVLQELSGSPLLGYFGLPLLWKRPTDHFTNPAARTEFWLLITQLMTRTNVVLATNNPLLSEQIVFQVASGALPVVRPHAAFTQAAYEPTRPHEVMLVSRTKFLWVTLRCAMRHFMTPGYPVSFSVANSDSSYTFHEMASYRAVVLVPWEHALMAFFEFYSMAVPLLMPDAPWAYRLVFDAEANLGSTTAQYLDVDPACDPVLGCGTTKHPHPPFAFTSLESRSYWYQYTSFAQFPHSRTFSSIPDLLVKLINLDIIQTSALMKAFNDYTFVRSAAFWHNAARRLTTGRKSCTTARS